MVRSKQSFRKHHIDEINVPVHKNGIKKKVTREKFFWEKVMKHYAQEDNLWWRGKFKNNY